MPAPVPPKEPVLATKEIQANSVPGFLKPHMALVALSIDDVAKAKKWLRSAIGDMTTLADAIPSRAKVRAYRRLPPEEREGRTPPGLDDLWMNIGFSFGGLRRLLWGTSFWRDLDLFEDEAFRAGLAARSAYLGDPTDPEARGHPANWKVGGPGEEPDALLMFAADDGDKLKARVGEVVKEATASGLVELYRESGHKHGEYGNEHFGFVDGVSQPGVRGRLSNAPDEYLTPRTIAEDQIPDAWLYGIPGQYLVWPGEFVFGYAGAGADPLIPGKVKQPGPSWSENGSYAVFRRLHQDVPGFNAFLEAQAGALAEQPGFEGMDGEKLGAHLVGRWKSGAPVARTPDQDHAKLGHDRLANNNFTFDGPAPDPPLQPPYERRDYPEQAGLDPIGLTCPLAAHIRKVNPRGSASDTGGRRGSFNRRILRRALPYGPRFEGPEPDDAERGLLFVCFQTSIVDQFEFLCTSWMGSPTNPRSPSGFDMLIGENGSPGMGRVRACTLLGKGAQAATVKTGEDYVIPTGGGYFFTPSVSAMRNVLAVRPGDA